MFNKESGWVSAEWSAVGTTFPPAMTSPGKKDEELNPWPLGSRKNKDREEGEREEGRKREGGSLGGC